MSACLADVSGRYDGTSTSVSEVIELAGSGRALPVCPEQLGGLLTLCPPAGHRFTPAMGLT